MWLCLLAVAAVGPGQAVAGSAGSAGPSGSAEPTGLAGPPDDDYVDRDCADARAVAPLNTTVNGRIDSEDDADTVRFTVEDGDTVAFRISAGETADEFTLDVHMLETEWTGRVEPGGNARERGDWDLGVVLKDASFPGYARAFAVVDDTMCVTVHDDPPNASAYPVTWSLRIVRNEVPDWYRTGDPTPTARSTLSPTPTATPTPAPTASSTPTRTPAPERVVDSDDDGVPDVEDYAPRDARVQEVGDVHVVTEAPAPSSNVLGFGPGFGPVVVLAVLGVVGRLVRRQ